MFLFTCLSSFVSQSAVFTCLPSSVSQSGWWCQSLWMSFYLSPFICLLLCLVVSGSRMYLFLLSLVSHHVSCVSRKVSPIYLSPFFDLFPIISLDLWWCPALSPVRICVSSISCLSPIICLHHVFICVSCLSLFFQSLCVFLLFEDKIMFHNVFLAFHHLFPTLVSPLLSQIGYTWHPKKSKPRGMRKCCL